MKNLKKVLAILLAFTLLCAAAACGDTPAGSGTSKVSSSAGSSASEAAAGSVDGTDDTGEAVSLNIWVAGSGDPVYDQTYRAVFDAYTAEHEGVSYELTFIPWGEYFTKLNTGLVGGAGPDLFMLGYGQMGTVQSMGYLLPRDEYLPEDWDGWDDFLPNVLEVCKNDDTMYALFSPATRVYFYRKDIADQQGVTADELKITSMEQLHALAEKMTVRDDSGNTVTSGLQVTTSQNSPEQQFMVEMTYFDQNAGLWDENLQPRFHEPAGIQSVEALSKLVNDGVSLISDPNVTTSGIITGTASMALSAEAGYKEADAAFPGQIGILDCDLNSLLIGNYMAVNKDSKNAAAAAEMLIHMFSVESCEAFADGMGQYSGRTSLDDAYVALNPEYENVVKAHAKSIPYSFEMNPQFNKMAAILRTALEEIYAGAEAEARLNAAAEEYQAVLAEAE